MKKTRKSDTIVNSNQRNKASVSFESQISQYRSKHKIQHAASLLTQADCKSATTMSLANCKPNLVVDAKQGIKERYFGSTLDQTDYQEV